MLFQRQIYAAASLAAAVAMHPASAGSVQVDVQEDVMTSGFFTGTNLVRGYAGENRAVHRVSTPSPFGVSGAETVYLTFDASDFTGITDPLGQALLTVTSADGGFGANASAASPFIVSAHAVTDDPLITITDDTNPGGTIDWLTFYSSKVNVASPEARSVIDGFGQVQIDVTQIVSAWLDGDNTAFAIAITGDNDTSGNDFLHGFVNNSEAPGSSFLTVTTVPEPGSLALLGLGGAVLSRRR